MNSTPPNGHRVHLGDDSNPIRVGFGSMPSVGRMQIVHHLRNVSNANILGPCGRLRCKLHVSNRDLHSEAYHQYYRAFWLVPDPSIRADRQIIDYKYLLKLRKNKHKNKNQMCRSVNLWWKCLVFSKSQSVFLCNRTYIIIVFLFIELI